MVATIRQNGLMTARTMRLGAGTYPVVLPSIRDPRLHLAAVIISVHILGQIALGFRVSVPQILTAILTCALIEVAWVFVTRKQIAWPASAMLTGSGVALILRIVGMERGAYWSWRGWHLFALVAGLSLVSKYVIRYRGSHLFNPSNLGLVVAFLVLGSNIIEPLDFWWAPINLEMIAAYAVILVGGLLITARLKLLSMAATFWVSLAVGLGVLSVSGHCITAAWSLSPVCGFDFWRAVMTSPELMIFLFFMITDPKTIPSGRTARIWFSSILGVACTLLMASQGTEFGAKVGLLAGLVLLTPLRFAIDRYSARFSDLRLGHLTSVRPAFVSGAAAGATAVLLGMGIVVAGAPAREASVARSSVPAEISAQVDRSSLPPVSVSSDAAALNPAGSAEPIDVAAGFAEALLIENQAMLTADTSLLRAASVGARLLAMERNIEAAATNGRLVVTDYEFESLELDIAFTDGPQGGASLAMAASGTKTMIEYDVSGAEVARTPLPFDSVFVLTPGEGGRWLIADAIDAG